jgi:hypothetical protein
VPKSPHLSLSLSLSLSLPMALAIDTQVLLDQFIPNEERMMDAGIGSGGRFQLHRVCIYAVVSIHEHGSEPEDAVVRDWESETAALDWQADQDDDLDELEVFHHLKQLAATRSRVRRMLSSRIGNHAATATLAANVQSPTFSARLQDRPASSFQRFSRRMCIVDFRRASSIEIPFGLCGESNFPYEVIPNVSKHANTDWAFRKNFLEHPPLLWTSTRQEYIVYWQVQIDYVDLHTPRLMSTQRTGKRRRMLHPCQQVSWRRQEGTSRAHHPPDAKRFKGVRFRPDRNRWFAEMKPPRCKNKVCFGAFQSPTDAARMVDVAFHYYGKPLNFADTPQILATRPPLPELGPEDKFNFVREQVKWLASIASTLPPSSSSPFARGTSGNRSPVPTPESSRGAIDAQLGFRSFSEISSPVSCGGADEADDGASQSRPWLYEALQPDLAAVDHAAVTVEGQSTLQGSAGNATADPCGPAISADFASGTFPHWVPSMLMDLLRPTPAFQAPSPSDFRDDVVDRLLEEPENFGCEEFLF